MQNTPNGDAIVTFDVKDQIREAPERPAPDFWQI
jgi:hypothetical protein